jgi:predicted RecB family nuclease
MDVLPMTVTSRLLEAYVKCTTKCFLRSRSEAYEGNPYANWVDNQNKSYRVGALDRFKNGVPSHDCSRSPTSAEDLKTAEWRLAVELVARAEDLESRIDAVERVPTQGPGRPSQFVPIRFFANNKLTRENKILIAFDALVLSKVLGRDVSLGKIIHGDAYAALNVKMIPPLAADVRKLIGKIRVLLTDQTPPDLVLNRHCNECEFQLRCRQKATEKDDLSQLPRIAMKDRKKLHGKGIFTVTQLSYTFRPRRRPKRHASKREKYHHSLKALAIRERKIHVTGSPELKLEGTPVYLDVEGLPDRDFYYLIGVRFTRGDAFVEHSLWADYPDEERRIWTDLLGILSNIAQPVLLHYGRYEARFLRQMRERYGDPPEASVALKAITTPVNVLSVLFAQIYFPVHSDGLKSVAGWLGFRWSVPNASGAQTIQWRTEWEHSRDSGIKQKLIAYNSEDCRALELVALTVHEICRAAAPSTAGEKSNREVVQVIQVDSMKEDRPYQFGTPSFALPAMSEINKAAYWNYQHDRVYVRSGKRRSTRRSAPPRRGLRENKVVAYPAPSHCPYCNHPTSITAARTGTKEKVLLDIHIGRFGAKRWIVRYVFQMLRCSKCHSRVGFPKEWRTRHGHKFGWNLKSYLIYNIIHLRIPQRVATLATNRLFSLALSSSTVGEFKTEAAAFYGKAKRHILDSITRGGLVHADETSANVKGKTGYVWVFTNLREAAYVYAESREANLVQSLLREFNGFLVSDFYGAYDSIACPQQKCLIHLMRDLNEATLKNPFDVELKRIVSGFTELLREVVQTVDQHGLKKYFLKRHLVGVERFYREAVCVDYQSEAAMRCKERFEKNRNRLFTFLNYDGIPWNNNNAEHAIKAFSSLRNVMRGTSTTKGIEEYLSLLTISETCACQRLDFLEFLCSRKETIYEFLESGRKGPRQ